MIRLLQILSVGALLYVMMEGAGCKSDNGELSEEDTETEREYDTSHPPRDTDPYARSDYTCPTKLEGISCEDESKCPVGDVMVSFGCSDGSVCCNRNEIPEGGAPCPTSREGVSCELFWVCWKEGEEMSAYSCDSGENLACCDIAGGAWDAGVDGSAGSDGDTDVDTDGDTDTDSDVEPTTPCPIALENVSCISASDCRENGGDEGRGYHCIFDGDICCIVGEIDE